MRSSVPSSCLQRGQRVLGAHAGRGACLRHGHVMPDHTQAGEGAVDAGQLARGPCHAVVHDHGDERMVRGMRSGERDAARGQLVFDLSHVRLSASCS